LADLDHSRFAFSNRRGWMRAVQISA
jgi:hypothetical protein